MTRKNRLNDPPTWSPQDMAWMDVRRGRDCDPSDDDPCGLDMHSPADKVNDTSTLHSLELNLGKTNPYRNILGAAPMQWRQLLKVKCPDSVPEVTW